MAASAGTRSCRGLRNRQAYIGFLGKDVFQGGNFQYGGWWDFKSSPGMGGFWYAFHLEVGLDLLPYSCGPLGQLSKFWSSSSQTSKQRREGSRGRRKKRSRKRIKQGGESKRPSSVFICGQKVAIYQPEKEPYHIRPQ